MEAKKVKETRVVQTDQVLINDLNNYHTLFGGVLMKKMDACAMLSARRHSRVKECVTASTDSVNFLEPIRKVIRSVLNHLSAIQVKSQWRFSVK